MIDSIAPKKVNPDGQLEVFDFSFNDISSNFEICGHKIEKSHMAIIYNQAENLKSILELARFNLVLSSGNLSKAFCEKIFSKTNLSLEKKFLLTTF